MVARGAGPRVRRPRRGCRCSSGIATGTAWLLLEVLDSEPSGLGRRALPGHRGGARGGAGRRAPAPAARRSPRLARGRRGLLLAGLFAAALPFVGTDGFRGRRGWSAALAAAGLAATAAALSPAGDASRRWGRRRRGGARAGPGVWDTGSDVGRPLTADVVAHAAVSVLVYVVVAVALAALGTLRDSPRLTGLATVALVVFTTFQSFAVFAQIVTGAWLFLLLGVVFLATGVLFDRARRGIAATLERGRRPVHGATGAGRRVSGGDGGWRWCSWPWWRSWSPPGSRRRLGGEEYRLRVAAHDPVDPFRGAYVALDYPDLRGPLGDDRPGARPARPGDVYVPLLRDGAVWRGRPLVAHPAAATRRTWPAPATAGAWPAASRAGSPARTRRASSARGSARAGGTATVRVDGRGHAVLVGLDAG